MKKICIEELDEGYIISSDEKKIAVSSMETAITKLKAFFGKTRSKAVQSQETKPIEQMTNEDSKNQSKKESETALSSVIHPSDLRIPRFDCDENQMKQYQNIYYLELS